MVLRMDVSGCWSWKMSPFHRERVFFEWVRDLLLFGMDQASR